MILLCKCPRSFIHSNQNSIEILTHVLYVVRMPRNCLIYTLINANVGQYNDYNLIIIEASVFLLSTTYYGHFGHGFTTFLIRTQKADIMKSPWRHSSGLSLGRGMELQPREQGRTFHREVTAYTTNPFSPFAWTYYTVPAVSSVPEHEKYAIIGNSRFLCTTVPLLSTETQASV